MTGSKWTQLLSAMDTIVPFIDTLGFQYISIIKFDSDAHPPVVEHIDPSNFQSSDLGLPGGGTNFGRPLLAAMNLISRWSQENTCYLMLTDGLASYPRNELELFNTFRG